MQGNVRVQSTFLQDGSTLRHKQGLHPCAIIYARPPKAETPSLNQQVFELLAFHPWGGGGGAGDEPVCHIARKGAGTGRSSPAACVVVTVATEVLYRNK